MIRLSHYNSNVLVLYKNTVQVYSKNMEHKGFIRCEDIVVDSLMSTNGMIVALCENKKIEVFNSNFQLARHLYLLKKPTSVVEIDGFILVSDKFGDVYKFKVDELPTAQEDANKCKDELAQNIILAHFSLINQIELSKKHNAIITCDRDEKVRITRYPRTDIIQSFCYGFVELVTSCKSEEINNVPIVVCGGCDGSLRIFKIENGEEIGLKQFDRNDVIIVYDVQIINNELQILINNEGKEYCIVKANINEGGIGELRIEKGNCLIKGGKFVLDDVIIYTSDNQIKFVKSNQLFDIKTDGSDTKFKNEGIIYSSMKKAITPKQRFIDLDDDDICSHKLEKTE